MKSPAMTTLQRKDMERYVNSEACGIILRDKLTQAYKAGFAARETEIENLLKHIGGDTKTEWEDV